VSADTTSADDEADASTPSPDPAPDREHLETSSDSRRGRVRALGALAALFFVGTVAMAVLSASLSSELSDERAEGDDRRDVQQVAARFAERLLTYDFRDLEKSKQAVLELATGKFRDEYEQAFKRGLQELFAATQARSTGTVVDVFAGPVEQGSATVIVVVDAVAQGTTGTRRTAASYIQLTLVNVAGTWRVDGVTNLNFGQPAPSGETPGQATTTTAPAG
jgi:Mce-associated membrane protein